MIAFLKHIFLDDFWLKFLSLSLAVLIWLTITFAIHPETSPLHSLRPGVRERTFQNLPVLIMSSAADLRNARVTPSQVDVTVQADARLIDRLQPRDIHVMVDLTGVEAARELRKRLEVSTPAEVTHVNVKPSEVTVDFPPVKPAKP